MQVPFNSLEDIELWWDAAYDAGFDDGWEGAPPTEDCGEMGQAYDHGYRDGKRSRELGGTP